MLNENNLILLNARAALTDEKNLNLVKETYGFVNTSEIVARFERQGWLLSDAKQAKVKSDERQGYQKHLLRFRNENFPRIDGFRENNESIPELIVENSHDGTSSLKIYFGVFRIACLNGIISGANFSSYRIIHSQNSIKKIDESIDLMTGSIPDLIKRVSQYSQIEMSHDKSLELAASFAALRLHNTKGVLDTKLDAMLAPRRSADTEKDAYSIFNVLQEKVIRGGIRYTQKNLVTGFDDRKTTRAINSVSQSVKLNREMWNSLEQIVGVS